MYHFIKETVLTPLALRVGTFIGAYLIGVGVGHEEANTITAGVVAGFLVAAELVAAYINRKKGQPS